MSDTAIKVENLSKQYMIGTREEGYKTFRETLMEIAKAPFKKLSPAKKDDNYIWALKDISFEIKKGEVVGIIGRNGAGKSTLLKILSKITEPTKGRIELRGRVGSLLEVGTGFHPELTGHENIYLYGAILGMDRNEITRKFDEIVAFAEIEKFIDTPVKRYSSGMYMRLAFAVAAHMETEILLVDEVLAVGDAAFQKKCLGKMGDVSQQGRTVLFVSHNMGAIQDLCNDAIYIENGEIINKGIVKDVVSKYLNSITSRSETFYKLQKYPRTEGTGAELLFESVWIESYSGERKLQYNLEEPFVIGFKYLVKKKLSKPLIGMRLETISGQIIIDSWDSDSIDSGECFPGKYTVKIKFEPQDLHPGHYRISLFAAIHLVRWLDKIDGALQIEILPIGTKRIWRSERTAILARIFEWERTCIDKK